MSTSSTGVVVLLGAPLGNPEDASPRVAAELARADIIAAEDTRRLQRLLGELGVTTSARVTSYFEANESGRTQMLIEQLYDGKRVAVITDGGMPSVSDPGFRLVRAAIDAGIPVTCTPGPSAVTTALALSGLPCDRFCFEGFAPRKDGERRRQFGALARERRTMVFFESPRRIADTLRAMADAFGPEREAALCRELTKTHEQVRRGGLSALAEGAEEDPPRGEITLVVAGWSGPDPQDATPEAMAAAVAELEAAGEDRKAAMKEVAARFGVSRRDVYNATINPD
ncbi:16S rRNA (cytidine(1402)-2'-O)-methyltransferase [Glycomyces buryatensis]|uniref:Ribosomal RNA small subunit methyltransferase I n=1 Tax=Glycomyces buryatensis TaxID=2570927 RepID=A0A4S8Q088_9ACTN|nr:16S rRNA (cytidine(1402)-2'-O)-methyltransferase [Glycomyces buryatensis]THV35782.1 16S rRNA (cytidine(1402)-2'-O)-methyltransferase [Glycomyces buryatensis]